MDLTCCRIKVLSHIFVDAKARAGREALQKRNHYPNPASKQCLYSACIPYQYLPTRYLLISKYISPCSGEAVVTNMRVLAFATISMDKLAFAHHLLNSNNAEQKRRGIYNRRNSKKWRIVSKAQTQPLGNAPTLQTQDTSTYQRARSQQAIVQHHALQDHRATHTAACSDEIYTVALLGPHLLQSQTGVPGISRWIA